MTLAVGRAFNTKLISNYTFNDHIININDVLNENAQFNGFRVFVIFSSSKTIYLGKKIKGRLEVSFFLYQLRGLAHAKYKGRYM